MFTSKVLKTYTIDLKNYIIVQKLSNGAYGTVLLIEHKESREKQAAKVSFLATGSNESQITQISREIGILIRVQAPTIIHFSGFSLTDFEGYPHITILMDYKENGSLAGLIAKEQQSLAPREYDNTTKQIILCGIAHGMMILHSRRVIHRDLKPENVLLDENYYPCITDFGLSKFLDSDSSKSQSQTGCGTPVYIAPELHETRHYGPKVDVYSFGILMFEVVTGERAFEKLMKKIPYHKFVNQVVSGKRPESKVPIKPGLRQLIERCWDKDPKKRPSFRSIFNKLSLSFEEDDEIVEDQLKDVITNSAQADEEEEEKSDAFDYSRYLLQGVDPDRLLDYVDEITTPKTRITSTTNDDKLQHLISEQSKRITELEQESQRNQANQAKIVEQTKQIAELKQQNQTIQESFKQQAKRIIELEQQNQEILKLLKNQPIKALPEDKSKLTNESQSKSKVSETSSSPSTQSEEPEKEQSLEGLNFDQIKETIQQNKLTRITIPSSAPSIPSRAFADCVSLKHVTIPSSVLIIKEEAFSRCSSLTDIIIPSSVISILEKAFAECSSLTQVEIPSSVKIIGCCPFYKCTKLESILVHSANKDFTSIDGVLFYNNSHNLVCYPSNKKGTTYTIPSSVSTIGRESFFECTLLTQITIPSSVKTIDYRAFSGCTSLTQITISSSVKTIEGSVFKDCINLGTINVDSNNLTYGSLDGVLYFKDRHQIIRYPPKKEGTTYTIPSSINSIDDEAFCNCNSLKQITIPSSVRTIEQLSFNDCINLESLNVNSKNMNYASVDGVLLSHDLQILIRYPPKKNGTTYTVPSSVTSIDDNGFYGCTVLTEIIIPSSVTSIGSSAFSGCTSLVKIHIPASVKSIGSYAIENCDKLDSAIRKEIEKKSRSRFGLFSLFRSDKD